MSHCDVIQTKWGTAKINEDGYYRITSVKEGYPLKLLHRIIYEEFYGVKLPKQIHIHHKDGNKLNNCILNLEAVHESDHRKLHSKPFSIDGKINRSKSNNTSGFFRVSKKRDTTCRQGFVWIYQHYVNGVRITVSSVSIERLKEKVLEKGWEWKEL